MGKYVGIIAAMPEEMDAIKSKMINTKELDIFNLKFFEGKIKNQKIILVKCGVGKVNAARTTQIMIDKFDIDYIINIGSAGSINDDVEYGDIVIGKYVLQHDFDITAFGHEKGYISNIGVKLESNTKLIKRCEYVIKNMKENNYKCVIGAYRQVDGRTHSQHGNEYYVLAYFLLPLLVHKLFTLEVHHTHTGKRGKTDEYRINEVKIECSEEINQIPRCQSVTCRTKRRHQSRSNGNTGNHFSSNT